jgi:hypothetical protein
MERVLVTGEVGRLVLRYNWLWLRKTVPESINKSNPEPVIIGHGVINTWHYSNDSFPPICGLEFKVTVTYAFTYYLHESVAQITLTSSDHT